MSMKYSAQEVMQYVAEEDVKFIRLAFCDVFGRQKNVSIMPYELSRAFEYGIAFDASAIDGFGDEVHSDLLLHPDPETLTVLPWRPEHGRVVRMYCSITRPDGSEFECDTRGLLKHAVGLAALQGYEFSFGSELEFYLFRLNSEGERTKIPYDTAGYMDIAPDDRGENVRREICLTLEQMGIIPESSHHEEGPGQNEIDFRYSDAVSAADNAVTFRAVVETVARRNGLWADFSPKPLSDKPGNGFHINISVSGGQKDMLMHVIAGLLDKASDMTAFLNPSESSYDRFGSSKAPAYITWSHENRSQLVRVPAAVGEYRRAELRSPDPTANPYLAFTLMIHAALRGLTDKMVPPPAADINLYTADSETLEQFRKLPTSLAEAISVMKKSDFIRKCMPATVVDIYGGR